MSASRIGEVLGRIVRCTPCERQRDAEMSYDHDFDQVAAKDPALEPTHRLATDSEWWAWVLSGGRDQ